MAIYGYPFGSLAGDRKFGIDLWKRFFTNLISTGVFMRDLPTSFQVVEKSGMTVTLKAGMAYIDGVFVYMDADLDFVISPSGGSIRHDIIKVFADYTGRDADAEVDEGAVAVDGIYPLTRDTSAYEIAVADVTVGVGVASIAQSNIGDLRLDTDHCGIVTSLIEQVDTSTLYAQIQDDLADFQTVNEASFTAWFASIQDIFDESAETNLLNLINARLKLDGTAKMTGDLQHGNHKSTYEDAGGVLIGDVEPVADGLKFNVYTAGANPKAFYIKNTGAITINDKKVWTEDNMKVVDTMPTPATLANGSIAFVKVS